MGRPESPVTGRGALPVLARWLRAQRTRADLSYVEIGQRVGLHVTTLSRAASGRHLPTWKTVEAFVNACDGDVRIAESLWRRAKIAHAGAVRRLGATTLAPTRVATVSDLIAALNSLRVQCGQPTLSQLATVAAKQGNFLADATMSDLLRAKVRSPRVEVVLGFARACKEIGAGAQRWEAEGAQQWEQREKRLWEQAWKRAMQPALRQYVEKWPPTQELCRRIEAMIDARYGRPLDCLAKDLNLSSQQLTTIRKGDRRRIENFFLWPFARLTGADVADLLRELGVIAIQVEIRK